MLPCPARERVYPRLPFLVPCRCRRSRSRSPRDSPVLLQHVNKLPNEVVENRKLSVQDDNPIFYGIRLSCAHIHNYPCKPLILYNSRNENRRSEPTHSCASYTHNLTHGERRNRHTTLCVLH